MNRSDQPITASADDWEAIFKQAEVAEERLDFHEAYREFARCGLAWIESDQIERAYVAILRAGLNLEKSQVWRAHSALWEMLGNRLGEEAYPGTVFESPNQPGQSKMFHIVSWTGWVDPENGYYDPKDAIGIRKHQQFWAYLWAAQTAEAEGYSMTAAENYRKAGFASELSKFGERNPDDVSEFWTRDKLYRRLGEKHRIAAECYAKAARNHVLATGGLRDSYRPRDCKWSKRTQGDPTALFALRLADDLQRMCEQWDGYRAIKEQNFVDDQWRGSFEKEWQLLNGVQRALIGVGNDLEAEDVFRLKRRREWLGKEGWARIKAWLKFQFLESRLGTRLACNFTLMITVTTFLVPFVYYKFSLVGRPESAKGSTFYDCILHSWASTLGMSVQQLLPIHPAGQTITVLQSFLLYFFLTFLAYVWTLRHGE